MERSLLWTAFGVSVSGYLYSLFLTHRRRDEAPPGTPVPPLFKRIALLLPVLAFVIGLLKSLHFKGGNNMGDGFLIGGLAAFAAAWRTLHAHEPTRDAHDATSGLSTALVAGPCSLAAAATSTCMLMLRPHAPDILMGIAMGWCAVTAILISALTSRREPGGSRGSRLTATLLASAGYAVLICTAVTLCGYRSAVAMAGSPVPVSWVAPVLVLAAVVPLVLLLTVPIAPLSAEAVGRIPLQRWMAAFYRRPVDTDEALRAAICGDRTKVALLLFAAVVYLLAHKVTGEPHLWQVIAIGAAGAAIGWWVFAADSGSDTERALRNAPRSSHSGLMAFVLTGCALMAAYTMLAGVGCAIAMISAWLVGSLAVVGALDRPAPIAAGSCPPDLQAVTATAQRMVGVMMFGLVLVLYRLFEITFASDLAGQSSDLYTLFGIMVGVALPRVTAAWPLNLEGFGAWRVAALAIAGMMLLLVPAAVFILWQAHCLSGLFEGLALSFLLAEFGSEHRAIAEVRTVPAGDGRATPGVERVLSPAGLSSTASALPAMLAVLAALATAQWTTYLDPLTSLHRLQRAHILEGLAAAILVLALVAEAIVKRRSAVPEGVGERA